MGITAFPGNFNSVFIALYSKIVTPAQNSPLSNVLRLPATGAEFAFCHREPKHLTPLKAVGYRNFIFQTPSDGKGLQSKPLPDHCIQTGLGVRYASSRDFKFENFLE
jgi:hypothetical protein